VGKEENVSDEGLKDEGDEGEERHLFQALGQVGRAQESVESWEFEEHLDGLIWLLSLDCDCVS
jgi:hypothetical protein